jgi:hypothetical protein
VQPQVLLFELVGLTEVAVCAEELEILVVRATAARRWKFVIDM